MNIQTNLFDFAFVPAWLEQLDELAGMTLPEPWSFVSPSKTGINTHTPILERYINTVFHKQALAYIFAQDAASADRDFYIRNEFAKQDSIAKWGGKIPPNLKMPLRDGDIDRPDDEAYAGCYFLNANSHEKPQIVDKDVQPILDQTEVYSGCYGNITVTFFGYNSNGNRGIAAGLGNIQKVKDGDPLGGRARASDEFTTVDDDEDFLS